MHVSVYMGVCVSVDIRLWHGYTHACVYIYKNIDKSVPMQDPVLPRDGHTNESEDEEIGGWSCFVKGVCLSFKSGQLLHACKVMVRKRKLQNPRSHLFARVRHSFPRMVLQGGAAGAGGVGDVGVGEGKAVERSPKRWKS